MLQSKVARTVVLDEDSGFGRHPALPATAAASGRRRLPGFVRLVTPPRDLYQRTRWFFLLFSLAIGLLLLPGSIGAALGHGWPRLLPAVAVVFLAVHWFREYGGHQAGPAWDLAEATVIFGLGVATSPIDVLMLIYARLAVRSLESRGWRLGWVLGSYATAFAASVAVSAALGPLATPLQELLFLATGFPIATVVMRSLSDSMIVERELAAERGRRETDALLSAIVQHTSDVILLVDQRDGIAYASPSLAQDFRHATPGGIADIVHPDDLALLRGALDRARAGADDDRVLFRLRAGGDAYRYVEAVTSHPPEAASLGGVVLTARDVTQRREADEALRQSEANFRALFTDNPQPMWVFDANTLQFLEVNEAALEKYGYSREEFLAMRVDEIRPSSEVGRLRETLDMEEPRHFSREWRHRLKDGRIIFVDITSHRLTFAGHPAVLVLAQDITERRELDDRLRHQAFHDTLTGLANRALFRDRVEQAVARGGRGDTSFAVLFIDLDNFKAINDSVGHTAGDVVLCEVARRLRAALRPSDTAARFGGDEFAVLIDVLTDDGTAIHVARRIADSLNHPVEAEGDTWFVSGSIGIAYGSHGAESVDAVLRNADVAMYDAKRRGRGQFAIFEPAMHESVLERMAMETELRQAIARDELSLVYQPQVDLRRARITGVEALVRWRHPRRGPILPGDFVPMAEEAGLIADLDAWVLRHATAQVRAWSEAGIRPISVAVNVSSKDFSDARLVERIAATVAAAGLQPAQVELEVTETAAFETGSAGLALTRLRELGFRVAIDDFGIGFSMLARLQDLPVDRLKIDRTFVEKITFGEDEAPIVSGIIAMAHSLRMEVVAEGVETSEQLAFLRRGGCDYGQGYRLGRPMPAEAIEPLLRDRAAAPPSTEGG